MNCNKCKRAKHVTGDLDAKCLRHGLQCLCKKAGITIVDPVRKPVLNVIKVSK